MKNTTRKQLLSGAVFELHKKSEVKKRGKQKKQEPEGAEIGGFGA